MFSWVLGGTAACWDCPDRWRQDVPDTGSSHREGAVAECWALHWRHDQSRRGSRPEAPVYISFLTEITQRRHLHARAQLSFQNAPHHPLQFNPYPPTPLHLSPSPSILHRFYPKPNPAPLFTVTVNTQQACLAKTCIQMLFFTFVLRTVWCKTLLIQRKTVENGQVN